MEKIKVDVLTKSEVEIPYGTGFVVKVNPIIKIEEQANLRGVYVNSFFKDGRDGDWDEQFAEFMFRRQILNLKTNIDIDAITNVSEIDELIWGAFFDKIKSAIINYNEVRLSINSTISNIVKRIEIEQSAGYLLKGIMSKVSGFLDEIKNLSPEDIEKLKASANEMVEQIKSSPISSILEDKNGNKPKKAPKKDKGYVQ